MRSVIPALILAIGVGSQLAAEPAIDGTSAPLWKPCVGWVKNPPTIYEVTNENGSLVFRAEAAGSEMPWIIRLADAGVSGDNRYLMVRYQATGLSTSPNVYFLHGEEGSRGGRNYATADALKVDGNWHTLAVDLLAADPLENTHQLAVKVAVGRSGSARLAIEKIQFVEQLPAGAVLVPSRQRPEVRAIAIDWREATPAPQAGWTPSPASQFDAALEGSAMAFSVRGPGRGMRWVLDLPEPIDLAAMPWLSLRYRATGRIAPTTYAIWLGRTGTERQSAIALSAGDLKAGGAWHNLSLPLKATFTANQLAVGLDAAGDDARVTFDTVHFTSRPRRWSLAEVLSYQQRAGAWPDGKNGYTTMPLAVTGGKPSPFFLRRLDLTGWFDTEQVAVHEVPFAVSRDPGRITQTSLPEFDSLCLELPDGAREVYLLTAAAAPPSEPWGIDWSRPKPQEILDVPEKVFYEIRYDRGPPDRVLPLDAVTRQWGVKRGLSVNAVHPDPTRRATALVLHDRMQTASFALVGATVRTLPPRIEEPNWELLSAGLAPASAPAAIPETPTVAAREPEVVAGGLRAGFTTEAGLAWSHLALPGLSQALACSPGPVFQVAVDGRVLPNEDWSFERMEPSGAARRFIFRNLKASLAATVDCLPGKGSQVLLRMTLTNEATTPTTATLHFPMLSGLRLASAADTWYLSGKRGGILNCADISLRDPLGERHPLQMDGFFNTKIGLALACLTHDTAAQHHFIALAKTEAGGDWSIEYVDRDLPPAGSFTATEAALVVLPGDWRAIFAAYTDWLESWYRPASPRKDWFAEIFATAAANVHYDACDQPTQRSDLQPLVDTMLKYVGHCDSVHLFGWGASQTYGDWGDYSHYEEIGGLERFRGNIQAMQEKGIAVSLYLDAYLNSDKGQLSGEHAKDWAMIRPDGSPQHVEQYDAYNECPYNSAWQDYLSRTYRRVREELGAKILYIDEYGSTDGRWMCHARDHGHDSHVIPYAGEAAMLERIRAAVGPDTALYTEYPPAEVSRRYLDGSITYQALWSSDEEPLAPHFIDLPRFAFPDFKQFHIIYYVGNRAGNWWLLKFPFFNGEVYRIGVPNLPNMDEPSREFLRRAVSIQCRYKKAFASRDVHPLVLTAASGVFANLFAAAGERVWTLYNANGRSVRGPLLRVKHVNGATYEDAWNGKAIVPEVKDGEAWIALELDPKGVGCVVQRLP